MFKRVALYLRVSTKDQSTANQRLELERWTAGRGYSVVEIYDDSGISGAKGRDQRLGFDRALKDAIRGRFDVLAAWDVSRLGRSLPDLVETLSELHAAKVDLFLHQQGLDTTTPSGRALFGMAAVFAEYERAMIAERVRAGLERARILGTKSGKSIGRPRISEKKRLAVKQALLAGAGVRGACRASGVGYGTVVALRRSMLTAGELNS